MRIVAIGLGGAGCRIVESLYSTDRKSSKVACIQGLAVDVDESTLKQLTALPESSRLFFPAMDPTISNRERSTGSTATIDIAEIISRMNNLESGETDAILICVGLGGSMADIAPHVITGLRSSIVEPIFGLVTLPCLAEGEKRSAKAADDVDILSPLLDGMILFDNETWYRKTKALKATLAKKEKSLAHRLGFAKAEPELSPELATYQLLNEGIVRRISLILRAGEFKADGGIDLAEVVLDSGEVLNTMKGMGFITIGYAVERLPSNPLAFLSQFRPQGVFDEENKKKASRIVDLAKQAIYHEVSTPCDMTSAHKALILIAGPSHELSMKGFMTVRKWIDRSIAGLETRSGDYPILNTKNVAIIIMLSGLENIPRLSELREIRTQYTSWSKRRAGGRGDLPAEPASGAFLPSDTGTIRDEMIVLPVKMRKGIEGTSRSTEGVQSLPHEPMIAAPARAPRKPDLPDDGRVGDGVHTRRKPPAGTENPARTSPEINLPGMDEKPPKPSHQRVIVTQDADAHPHRQAPVHSSKDRAPVTAPASGMQQSHNISKGAGISHARITTTGDKEAARQRIELELQKQRFKAMSGRGKPADEVVPQQLSSEPVRKRHEIRTKPVIQETTPPLDNTGGLRGPEQKTVIISKRRLISRQQETPLPDTRRDEQPDAEETPPQSPIAAYPPDETDDDMTVTIKDSTFRARDRVFEGRSVQKPKTATAKDASLLHTSLKPKKPEGAGRADLPDADDRDDTAGPDHAAKKKDKTGKTQDDVTWV
jgi:tubulin-like protein CetZ